MWKNHSRYFHWCQSPHEETFSTWKIILSSKCFSSTFERSLFHDPARYAVTLKGLSSSRDSTTQAQPAELCIETSKARVPATNLESQLPLKINLFKRMCALHFFSYSWLAIRLSCFVIVTFFLGSTLNSGSHAGTKHSTQSALLLFQTRSSHVARVAHAPPVGGLFFFFFFLLTRFLIAHATNTKTQMKKTSLLACCLRLVVYWLK